MKYLTVKDLAELFQKHENTIYKWLDDGTIFPNARRVKDGWKVPDSDIELLQQRRGLNAVRDLKEEANRDDQRGTQVFQRTDGRTRFRILPAMSGPCVYVLLDSDQRVLYVGQSVNVLARIATHRKRMKSVVSVILHSCTRERLDEIEGAFIEKYQPPLNVFDGTGRRITRNGD